LEVIRPLFGKLAKFVDAVCRGLNRGTAAHPEEALYVHAARAGPGRPTHPAEAAESQKAPTDQENRVDTFRSRRESWYLLVAQLATP
jgi:hypothetical protein